MGYDINLNRVPPQNIDAERSVLGAMLLPDENRISIPKVLKIIDTDEIFYKTAHCKIFNTIRDMYIGDHPVDLVTLTAELQKKGILEEVGDVSYLDEMMDSVPTAGNVDHYSNIIKEDYIRRKLFRMSMLLQSGAYDPTTNFETMTLLLEDTQKLLHQ